MARRKNRKKKQDGFIFPVPFAGIVVMLASVGLVYVWLGCRCEQIGGEITKLEKVQAELRKQLVNEEYRWSRLRAPHSVETALARCGIVMDWPRGNQVVRLFDADNRYEVGLRRADTVRYARLERTPMHE